MTSTTNFFKRIFNLRKAAKKNPDWARVEEPDTIARPAVFGIFGMLIAGFSVLAAILIMTTSPIEMIARFLASFNSTLAFPELYAAFGAALIALCDLVVATVFMMFAPADHDDIVEMISDLDANMQERIVELEASFNEKLSAIERQQ